MARRQLEINKGNAEMPSTLIYLRSTELTSNMKQHKRANRGNMMPKQTTSLSILILTLALILEISTLSSQAIDLSEKQFNLEQKVGINSRLQVAAPRFLLEPPSLVEYSNSTGAVVACKASAGLPTAAAGLTNSPSGQLQETQATLTWRSIGRPASATSMLDEQPELEQQVETQSGQPATKATQSRYARHDGSLVVAPFKASEYRPEVHSGTYRCCLTNQLGSLCSRPVRLKAVLDSEAINLDVFDEFALAGNLVAIKCQAPSSSVSRHLHAYSWYKDDKLLVSQQQNQHHQTQGKQVDDSFGSSRRSKLSFSLPASSRQNNNSISPLNQKFFIQPNGDLIIRNASKSDAANYKCKARHKLTGAQVASKIGGQLIIDETHNSANQRSELKQLTTNPLVWTRENAQNFLLCAQFQSVPLASYRWFKLVLGGAGGAARQIKMPLTSQDDNNNNNNEDDHNNINNNNNNNNSGDNLGPQFIRQLDSCLLFSQVQQQHQGIYICEATQKSADSAGKQQQTSSSSSIRLVVTSSQLSAQVNVVVHQFDGQQQQQQQLISSQVNNRLANGNSNLNYQAPLITQFGSTIHLNCSITGQPYDTIAWFKDTQLLAITTWPNPLTGFLEESNRYNSIGNQTSSWLNPTFFQPRQQQQQQLDQPNLKLTQPTVIQIENFTLKERGIYQCQAYSSLTSAANLIDKLLPEGISHKTQYESNLARLNHLIEYSAERDFARSASGSLQIDVAFLRPTIVQKFPPSQLIVRNSPLTLQCGASGLPVPRVLWFLDDQLIVDPSASSSTNEAEDLAMHIGHSVVNLSYYDPITSSLNAISDERFQISVIKPTTGGQYQGVQATIVSQLNVSQADVSETGQYKCVAVSSIGSQQHVGQVNVINPQSGNGLQLRPYQIAKNFTLISGRSATLQCPLVGFPLSKVEWFHQDKRLPVNPRQRIEPIKLGVGGQLELGNVDRETDGGLYTCRATLNATATITAFGDLGGDKIDANLVASNEEDLVGQVQTIVRVAPQIDTQTLPESVQTNEGMRTKLVCSIVQGDHPIELRWLRRVTDKSKFAQVGKSRWFGFELMQNSMTRSAASQLDSVDAITVLNLDDSCQLTFKQINYLDSGDYLCVAQNDAGQMTRQTRLVVNLAPEWSKFEPPSEHSVLLGSRLQLDCQAHGHPSPSVAWKRNYATHKQHGGSSTTNYAPDNQQSTLRIEDFVELAPSYRQRGYVNGTLVVEQVDEQDSGAYLCEVANGVGVGLSKVVHVKVNVPPYFKVFNNQANKLMPTLTQLAQASGKAELKCQAHGDQPMIVGWLKGSSEVIDLVRDSRQRVVTENALSSQIFESTLTIKDLTRNDSAPYTCVASNEFGTEEMRIHLIVQEPPEAPILLRPIRTTSRQATISFRPPYSGNSLVKRYAIYYKPIVFTISSMGPIGDSDSINLNHTSDDLSGWQSAIVEAPTAADGVDTSSLILAGSLTNSSDSLAPFQELGHQNQLVVNLNLCCLKPFTRYLVRVRAINELGQSAPSKVVAFVTDEEAIGGPPLDVGVEPTGAHSLKVRWRAPAVQLQNGQIRGYYIGYRANLLPAQSQSHQIGPSLNDKLAKSQASNAKLFSDNFVNEGEQYQYKNIQLDLSPASQLAAVSTSNTNRPQSWPLDQFDQQQLDASLLNATLQQQQQMQAQVYTSYLTNLRRKTSYSVIVQAYNKIGAGPRSDQIIVSTLDAAPPMSPILRLVSVDYNSAQLKRAGREFSRSTNGTKSSSRQSSEVSLTMFDSSDLNFDSNFLDEDDDPQSYYTINYRLEERRYGPQGGTSLSSGHNLNPLAQAQQQQQQQQPGGQQVAGPASDSLSDQWAQKKIQKRQQMPYLLSNLRCGSYYLAYMTATNSLGQSEPGESIRFNTLGAAPVAPSDSHDFLLVNSTFVILKLDAWQNAGCLISSFVIKYKSAGQSKWSILEHQVHPTQQTTTLAGPSVFATRPAAAAGAVSDLPSSNLQESSSLFNLEAQARSLFRQSNNLDFKPQRLVNKRQELNDFIIRNLMPNSNYRLIVEANSESGSTVAEYEFDTNNFSSSTVAINVHGIVASDIEAQNNNNFPMNSNSNNNNFRQMGGEMDMGGYTSNGQRASTNPLHRYTLGVWSLTVVFVVASIFMASATLVLGLRSIIRMKPRGGNGSSSSRDNLISSLLCCSNSASSNSSNADSSHSSSGGTCYHLPEHNQMSEVANYCSLPASGLLLSPMKSFRNRMNAGELDACDLAENQYAPPNFRSQLVTSSSLSTIGGRYGPSMSASGGRHTQTLSRLQHLNSADAGSPMAGDGHIRAHYAATLGKQQHQQQQPSQQFSFVPSNGNQCVDSQPLKYNVSSLYDRNQIDQQQNYLTLAAAAAANKDNNLYNPTSGSFRSPMQLGSSEAGTSGYETNSYGKTMNESRQQLYNVQNYDAYRPMSLYDSSASGSGGNNPANNNLFLQQQSDSQLYAQQQQGNINELVVQNQGHHNADGGCINHQLDSAGSQKLATSQQQQQSMLAAMGQLNADAYGVIFGNGSTGSGTNGPQTADDQLNHQLNSLIQMQQQQQQHQTD